MDVRPNLVLKKYFFSKMVRNFIFLFLWGSFLPLIMDDLVFSNISFASKLILIIFIKKEYEKLFQNSPKADVAQRKSRKRVMLVFELRREKRRGRKT